MESSSKVWSHNGHYLQHNVNLNFNFSRPPECAASVSQCIQWPLLPCQYRYLPLSSLSTLPSNRVPPPPSPASARPTQPVTLNAGFRMPSWFDLRSLDEKGPEDAAGEDPCASERPRCPAKRGIQRARHTYQAQSVY